MWVWCLKAKQTRRGWLNFVLRVQKITFFSLKTLETVQICSFLALTAKKSPRKLFGRLVKSVLVLSIINVLRKTSCFGTLFFSFWDFEYKFHALWQNKLSEVVKTSFYVSRRSFFSVKTLKIAQMFSFVVLTAERSLRKLFGRPAKSVFVLSTITIWGELAFSKICFISFLEFWLKLFCVMEKK